MMFLIGQGERTIAIGPADEQHCLHCDMTTKFQPQLKYKYGEFNILFGFIYDKRYQLACLQCNHGWIFTAREAEQIYGKPPLPLRMRYGFLILLAFLAIGGITYFIHHAA